MNGRADPRPTAVAALAAIGLVVLVLWFGSLGIRSLVPSDEGRYAEIAREMVATGDWVTIRYNGVKYFEKPPLHLWLSAASFEAFGTGAWQARLGGALAGLLAVVAMGWAGWRWYGARVGVLVAAILASTPLWTLAAHFNSLDITVAGFLGAALACFLIGFAPGTTPAAERRWLYGCWAAMALAVLAKGLIGLVLPGLALAVYAIAARQWRWLGRLHWWGGLAIFLAIVAPWFILVSLRNPEFASFFFIHEHWQRFTSPIHHRTGPIWYFVPIVIVGCLPWTLAARPIARPIAAPTGAAPVPGGSAAPLRPLLLASCWAGAIFAFFSLSSSKLPGYILPILPALALPAAVIVDRLDPKRWRWLLGLVGLIGAAVAVAAFPLEQRLLARPGYSDVTPGAWIAVAAAGLALVAGAALGWREQGRRRPGGAVDRDGARGRSAATALVVALATLVSTTLMTVGYEPIGRERAGIALVAPMRSMLTPSMPLYGVGQLDHTLPFYLGHPMTLVGVQDELAFGLGLEPTRWIPTIDQFIDVWTQGPRAMALMPPDIQADLERRGVPMIEVARDRRRVAVMNRISER